MTPCLWCRQMFHSQTRGGHAKKFCATACKDAFHVASRAYVMAMIEAGNVSVHELKRVYSVVHDKGARSGVPEAAE